MDVTEAIELALKLQESGDLATAADIYRAVLKKYPRNANALHLLGTVFLARGEYKDAMAAMQAAIDIYPCAVFYSNLGRVCIEAELRDDAVRACCKALELNPDHVAAHNNLGTIFYDAGNVAKAIEHFSAALRLAPDKAEHHSNLAAALKDFGDMGAAFEAYRRSIHIQPTLDAYSGLLFTSQYTLAETTEELKSVLGAQQVLEEAIRRQGSPSFSNERTPGRRLKIGYVSGDFRKHPVGYFFMPILENHDRQGFEVHCYYNHTTRDEISEEIASGADSFVHCRHLSDDELARRIQVDGIDILVDLAGHTALNRLGVFARRAAPVQMTYLGYVDTTGLRSMDYWITQKDTEHGALFSSETRLPMAGAMWCFRPHEAMPEVSAPPLVKNQTVTFGSLNKVTKISAAAIDAWVRVVHSVEGSRLLIVGVSNDGMRSRLEAAFASHGLGRDRIVLLGTVSHQEFWRLHEEIDIALDPFPYNGGTTTCESLWQGVPVVALEGGRFAGRMAASLLRTVGLEELVAKNIDDYISIASGLAGDRERLAPMRAGMRDRLRASALMDEQGYIAELESLYRKAWQRWLM